MVEYATAECATCHAIRPMNEMREEKVRRVTGKSYGSGTSRGSTNSHSTGFGGGRPARNRSGNSSSSRSHSNSRTHMAVERVWVCMGCKSPKSDLSPTAVKVGVGALGVAALLIYGAVAPPNPKTASDTEFQAPQASEDKTEAVTDQPDGEQAVPVVSAELETDAADDGAQDMTAAESPPSADVTETSEIGSAPAQARPDSEGADTAKPQFDGIEAARQSQRKGEEERLRIEQAEAEKMDRYARQPSVR